MIGKTFVCVNSTADMNGVHTVRLLPEEEHENHNHPKGVVALAGIPLEVTERIARGEKFEVVFLPLETRPTRGRKPAKDE